MPAKQPRSYQLSSALVASSVGAGVVCLAPAGFGRTYRLHARRPGAERNRLLTRADLGGLPAPVPSSVVAPVPPSLVRVDISGPIEQRAGFHDPCGGWTDGNDAICERLCEAFAAEDVLLVGDTPGGAVAGCEQGIARVLAAKAKNGRRCIGFANEQIGSLGMWWFLAVCDEFFLPVRGQVGSIGARGGHLDISEAMAKAGERLTYSVWPNEGKIAQAPELPLSPLGKARNDRDVALVGEAFCAAVCGGPIGLRFKLDRDAVVALGADMLTGAAAVGVLAHGVEIEPELHGGFHQHALRPEVAGERRADVVARQVEHRAVAHRHQRRAPASPVLAGVKAFTAQAVRHIRRFMVAVQRRRHVGTDFGTRLTRGYADGSAIKVEVCTEATACSAAARDGGSDFPRLSARRRMPRQAVGDRK